MNLSLFKTKSVKFAALLLTATALLTACSKKSNNPLDGFPKKVTVEYRITSLEGNNPTAQVTYTNETGATTSGIKPLPFTATVTRTVGYGEGFYLGVITDNPGKVRLQIFADGKEVIKEEPANTSSIIQGSIVHQVH